MTTHRLRTTALGAAQSLAKLGGMEGDQEIGGRLFLGMVCQWNRSRHLSPVSFQTCAGKNSVSEPTGAYKELAQCQVLLWAPEKEQMIRERILIDVGRDQETPFKCW